MVLQHFCYMSSRELLSLSLSLSQRRSRACQGPQSLAKNTMRATCARRRVVVVVAVVVVGRGALNSSHGRPHATK